LDATSLKRLSHFADDEPVFFPFVLSLGIPNSGRRF
jgi:hypothetical protein